MGRRERRPRPLDASRDIQHGDTVTFDVTAGVIMDETSRRSFRATPWSPVLQAIASDSGLVLYVRRRPAASTR